MADEAKLKEAFAKFDKDGSGYIEGDELKEALKSALENCDDDISDDKIDEYADKVMAAVDTSGDGKISFDEFAKAFFQGSDD